MRRYLVLGHKGQLGSEFCRKFDAEGREYQGYDLDEKVIRWAKVVIGA